MSNLKKFEETLGSLDLEVNRLNAVSQAYKKLEDLVESYDTIINELKENNTTFIKIKDEQNKHLNSIEDNFKKINKSIHQANLKLNSSLEDKIDVIRKENKEFYRDLESTIKIKLDDNKSQIKQLIESERLQLKQIIESNIKKSEGKVNSNIDELSEVQAKSMNILKWSIWVIGFITIILLALLIFKFSRTLI
jgi:CHASE3 domain sensor protein